MMWPHERLEAHFTSHRLLLQNYYSPKGTQILVQRIR
jgi:hypothetical protein